MRFIYNIFIYFYGFGVLVFSLFNQKAKKLRMGQAEALSLLKRTIDPNARYIWFHAASLGEFEQGRPVMEQLKKENPQTKILLTFFSPSGYEIRKNYVGADVISYLPLDTKASARRFVKLVNPSKAIFIKYEFWPNYILELQKTNVPVYSISAIFRPSQIFFKGYGSWYRNLLKSFAHIFVQDKNSLQLLTENGFSNVSVAGDTRFDRVADLAQQAKTIPLIEAFVKDADKVIVAGSTWPKDEELLVRYMKLHPDIKLILVPHEIHQAHIMGISKLLDGKFVRYTELNEQNVLTTNCIVVDTIGMLSSIYRYANVAYIGGGFGVGIHNTLEAAVWNVPVVFGPNYQKFREARELIAIGGAFSIAQYELLEAQFDTLLKDKNSGIIAGDYVKNNTGATEIIIKEIIHSNKVSINLINGDFTINDETIILPETSYSELTQKYPDLKTWDVQNGYKWIYFNNILSESYVFYISVCFYNNKRSIIILSFYSDDIEPFSWNDWSEEKELLRMDVFDKWLTERYGSKRKYDWGSLSASFDSKGGSSNITIKYC